MYLSDSDKQILEQTFSTILLAFGRDEFEARVGPGSLNLLERSLMLIRETSELERDQIQAVTKYFSVSREIIDPVEFQTLTGFTWEEGAGLLERLNAAMSQSGT